MEYAASSNESCLPIQTVRVTLRTLNDGLLLPWTSPALRGMVLKPLRDHFCHIQGGREVAQVARESLAATGQPSAAISALSVASVGEGNYCVGCIKNAHCPYGRVFEPDLNVIDPSLIRRNDSQGVRGISIATDIVPADSDQVNKPIASLAGSKIAARLLAVGRRSIELLPIAIEAIDAFGQSHGLGYQAPVRFGIDYAATTVIEQSLDPASLSLNNDAGTLPAVTIEFESPLLLKSCFQNGQLIPPTFQDLLSNSVRIILRCLREYHDPRFLETEVLTQFLSVANEVGVFQHSLVPFAQGSLSHRGVVNGNGYRERPLHGWLGNITFKDVPASYLSWLHWAGQLGIGSDRNRGAGLWRMSLN